jgi:nucleoid-associated protein YgaU
MFDTTIDIERVFDQDEPVPRTDVRRRRVAVAAVTAMAAVLAGATVVGASPTHASGRTSPRPVMSRTYVVAAGDTIWGIASNAAPGRDPRPVVEAIERANHVLPDALVPGQTLVIPSIPAAA